MRKQLILSGLLVSNRTTKTYTAEASTQFRPGITPLSTNSGLRHPVRPAMRNNLVLTPSSYSICKDSHKDAGHAKV